MTTPSSTPLQSKSGSIPSLSAQKASVRSGKLNDDQYEDHKRREAAREIKQKVLSILPPPEAAVSGWTTKGFQESKLPGCPAGMERVYSTEYIFISPGSVDFNNIFNVEVRNTYELRDIDGKRLFFAIESLEAFSKYPSANREIDITLIGNRGGFLCGITGSEKGYKIINQLNQQDHLLDLGSINRKMGVFHVKDSVGHELFTVKKTTFKGKGKTTKTEYKVMDHKTHALVGHIRPTWTSSSGELGNRKVNMPDMFGVQFDKLMSPASRSLLLCLTMVLYFKENEPINYGQNRKHFVIGLIYNIFVAAIILVMITIAILLVLFKKPKSLQQSNEMTNSTKPSTG